MSLLEKLSIVQSELNAPKTQFNSFGNYNYRNCEDILEAVKPYLKEQKLTLKLTDEIVLIGNRYYAKSTAKLTDAETGDSEETFGWAREEETKKGMDSSQITGAATSYARKYALNGLFCIDDNKDSDTTNTQGKDKVDKTKSNTNNSKQLTDKQVQRLYVIANKAGYDAESIKVKVKTKYNKEIKDLTKAEYDYICNSLEGKTNV